MCCKPKKKKDLKKTLGVEAVNQEIPKEQFEVDLDEDEEAIEHSKVLWIRGANRIQNQVAAHIYYFNINN